MANARSFYDETPQQGMPPVLFLHQLQATTATWAKLSTTVQQFLQAKKHVIGQWYLTINTLSTESQWQQILASWLDIQEGRLVTTQEAFADLDLLEETEGVCHE